jgi:hypothetical protein
VPTVSFDETGYTNYPCESGKYSTVLFCKFTELPIFTVEFSFETFVTEVSDAPSTSPMWLGIIIIKPKIIDNIIDVAILNIGFVGLTTIYV